MRSRASIGKWGGALLLACVLGAQETTPPPTTVETCGTDVPKSEAELAARTCPDGYIGQWYQERKANSCDWQPLVPQWGACALKIEADGPPPEDPVDPPTENGPGKCEKPYPASSAGCPKG